MVYTVTLDPETEQAIERKATRLGVSPSDYLRNAWVAVTKRSACQLFLRVSSPSALKLNGLSTATGPISMTSIWPAG